MTVVNFYHELRTSFPNIAASADAVHRRIWDEPGSEFTYSWFESLAGSINEAMLAEIDAAQYRPLFEFIESRYLSGDEAVKNCIDVAFTENLFWQVPAEQAAGYWQCLPKILKELYVQFHQRRPV